jgi:hypothetical protein
VMPDGGAAAKLTPSLPSPIEGEGLRGKPRSLNRIMP